MIRFYLEFEKNEFSGVQICLIVADLAVIRGRLRELIRVSELPVLHRLE